MSKPLRDFALFFGAQCLAYGVITWNWRMIAQARYPSIFTSDLLYAAINFSLIQKVAKAESKAAWCGYVLGGAVGSVCAAWITKQVYGQ
jgi:hypothetical protein